MNKRISIIIAVLAFALGIFAASIETDRPWYIAGETMKVSITTENALIAYAELCDTHSLSAGCVIGIYNGKGSGTIELPSDLHSGYYVLSVYTRDNANVSNRLVAIINPLRKSKDDDIEWVSSKSSVATSTGSADLINKKDVEVRETEGHIIKARVKNGSNVFKSNQIRPSLSVIGKQIRYFEGKMINDSIACFYTYDIHGKQPIILSAVTNTDVSLPIEIISPFAALIPKKLPHLVFHYNRSEIEARSIEMQRLHPSKEEQDDDTQSSIVPLYYDDTVFGSKPIQTYNLDEYRQFLTVREVLLEYVIFVSKRKVNGVPQLFVSIDQAPNINSWPSLVLIDGMPISNIERLLNYDARRIHHINIYGGQYTFGNGIYNGILSFVTRSGLLTNYPTEPNTQYLLYDFPE
jgi:hypothetical protein